MYTFTFIGHTSQTKYRVSCCAAAAAVASVFHLFSSLFTVTVHVRIYSTEPVSIGLNDTRYHAILTDYALSVLLLSQLFFAVFSQCVRVCITNTIQSRYNIFAVCNAKRRHCFTHRSICRASVYSTVHITHFTSSYVQFYVDGLFIRIHTHTHIACILHMSLAFSIES